MRLFCLCNGQLGLNVVTWLREQGETIVGLAVHPPARRRLGEDIIMASGLPPDRIFDGSGLEDDASLARVVALAPDVGVSVLFGYILRGRFLSLFPRGVVNLHPALLPYNRGAYPNVWSIVDRTPAGATLHYVDPGVDTGDIVTQVTVPVSPVDNRRVALSPAGGGRLRAVPRDLAAVSRGRGAASAAGAGRHVASRCRR